MKDRMKKGVREKGKCKETEEDRSEERSERHEDL